MLICGQAIWVVIVAMVASGPALLGEGASGTQDAVKRFEARHAGVLRVGGDVKPPKLIRKINPQFPKKKMRFREFTPIILEAVITEIGEVVDPTVVTSVHPDLDPIVLAAIRQWRYEPARRKGKPVPVFLTVTVLLEPGYD